MNDFQILASPKPRPIPPPPSRLARSFRFARIFAVAYLVIILLMLLNENRLIFYPSRIPYQSWTPTPGGEDVVFESTDGVRLVGWYLPHPDPQAIVLFHNGNGGNMTHWRDPFARLHKQCRATVMGFDYRGYGRSSGSPDEQGVLADARAARKWLAAKTGVAENQIVLMGRSLGGGVAINLAKDGARAVVVESTFTSLPAVAARIYPWLPIRWVMRTQFDSLAALADYRGPLFISHGDADELVPYAMGRALYDAAATSTKRFYDIPHGRHNDPPPPAYYDELSKFFAALP